MIPTSAPPGSLHFGNTTTRSGSLVIGQGSALSNHGEFVLIEKSQFQRRRKFMSNNLIRLLSQVMRNNLEFRLYPHELRKIKDLLREQIHRGLRCPTLEFRVQGRAAFGASPGTTCWTKPLRGGNPNCGATIYAAYRSPRFMRG